MPGGWLGLILLMLVEGWMIVGGGAGFGCFVAGLGFFWGGGLGCFLRYDFAGFGRCGCWVWSVGVARILSLWVLVVM